MCESGRFYLPLSVCNEILRISLEVLPSHVFDFSIDKHFGLMRCRVLPPMALFDPVLPQQFQVQDGSENLCSAEQNFDLKCCHSHEERSFEGCWTTVGVYTAVRMGHEILDIFEVWDYRSRSAYLYTLL